MSPPGDTGKMSPSGDTTADKATPSLHPCRPGHAKRLVWGREAGCLGGAGTVGADGRACETLHRSGVVSRGMG